MIEVTKRAAERLKEIQVHEEIVGHGVRLGVLGGGCSGLTYSMNFDESPKDNDSVIELHGLQFFIDPKSYLFINGIELDYSDELLTGGFKFNNPNAQRSCSCGTSFSV